MEIEEIPPVDHLLIGSICTCGNWRAGCGNNIPEQWRQHVNAAERNLRNSHE